MIKLHRLALVYADTTEQKLQGETISSWSRKAGLTHTVE